MRDWELHVVIVFRGGGVASKPRNLAPSVGCAPSGARSGDCFGWALASVDAN